MKRNNYHPSPKQEPILLVLCLMVLYLHQPIPIQEGLELMEEGLRGFLFLEPIIEVPSTIRTGIEATTIFTNTKNVQSH